MGWGSDAIFFANFFGTHHFVAAAVTGAVDVCQLRNELSVVLIGGEHIALYSDGIGFFCQCSNHIIGLKAIDLEDRNMVCT